MKITRDDDPAKAGKKLAPRAKDEDATVAKSTTEAASTVTTTERLTALTAMNLGQLRDEYAVVFGKPSLSRNRKQLVKKIAEKIQADAETQPKPVAPTLTVKFERKRGKKAGDSGKGRSKRNVAAEAKESAKVAKPARQRDARLPRPGTILERVYKGKTLKVTVTEDGFEYQGKPFRSLSALAMAITGAKAMNGFLFFALGKYAKPARLGVKEKAAK